MHLFETYNGVGTYDYVSMAMIDHVDLRSILKNDDYIARPLMAGFKSPQTIGDKITVLQTTLSSAAIDCTIEVTHELVSREQFMDIIEKLETDDRDDELLDRLSVRCMARSNLFVISTMRMVPIPTVAGTVQSTELVPTKNNVNYHGSFVTDLDGHGDVLAVFASAEDVTHRMISDVWTPIRIHVREEFKRHLAHGEDLSHAFYLLIDGRRYTVCMEEVDAESMRTILQKLGDANFGKEVQNSEIALRLNEQTFSSRTCMVGRITPVVNILGL